MFVCSVCREIDDHDCSHTTVSGLPFPPEKPRSENLNTTYFRQCTEDRSKRMSGLNPTRSQG